MARRCDRALPFAIAGAAVGALAGTVAAMALTGVGIRRPRSFPEPARSIDDAWQRVERLRIAEEVDGISPTASTTLLSPAEPAPDTPTVVLMHGLTMTPDQFEWVGQVLCDLGYRVLLPRMPDHGRSDKDATHLARLTGERLAEWADGVIDIAHGFGGPVWIEGLSAGGLLACWCAQVRPEVTRVAAIAPFAAPHGYRWSIVRLAARAEGLLPTTMHLWDDRVSSPYGYEGFPVRGASAFMVISEALYDHRLPAASHLERATLVLNDGDNQVSDPRGRDLFRACFRGRADSYAEVTLPAEKGWHHDFIDPWLDPRPEPHDVLRVLLGALGIEGDDVDAAIAAYRPPAQTA